MNIFLDSADVEEVKFCNELGILDGLTTNPSIVAKEVSTKNELYDRYSLLCDLCKDKPISLEVLSNDIEEMKNEAIDLSKISSNVCVKLPITENGLKVCRFLSEKGIATNMTLCFSPMQALLCAKFGATFVSPFVGRMDDIANGSGIELVSNIRQVFNNYGFETLILSASIRNLQQLEQVAIVGSDIATIPFKIVKSLYQHNLTDSGLKKFNKDGEKLK